jgi:hypothetical protein
MDNDITTISVKEKTKKRFDQLGTTSMTADDVLNSLIDFWTKYKDVVKK